MLALGLAAAACDGGVAPNTDGAQIAYLRDAGSRRAALVASLVNPGNGYSALRLAHYGAAGPQDWELLTPWNPRVAPVGIGDLDGAVAQQTLPAEARALELPDEATWNGTIDLEALGREAFFRYPTQIAPPVALTPALAERYGLWRDPVRGVGGLVRAEVPGGSVLALTCATCHADVLDGQLVAGVPSARFDLGRMLVDGAPDSAFSASLLAWGPGRVDVTTGDASLPERISDLRPTRWLTHLQYDATVRQRDVVALAIRIETLIITTHGQTLRPPRIVALALARYLWSLGASQVRPTRSDAPGAAVFAAHCSRCHDGEGFTGAPRPLAEVGTNPTLGLSPDRGTGFYRVPSLRGVGGRPTLLHDGSLTNLTAMFDPARLANDWTGGARGPGPVAGHVFGLELSPTDRAALVTFVESL